jgi:peroxiredoxin Q/BCP
MAKDLQEGDAAPDFDMAADSGGRARLADHKGRALVLYFYPKDDTPGCTREAIDFTGLLPKFHKAGAEIIGVSRDTAAKHDKFKTKHALKIALASDEDGRICEAYGVWKEKTLYGRKYMGVERSTFLIDANGRIARVWRGVRVPGHAGEVLEAARELA